MIGQKLLHYDIVEKLGEGGMGVVYKARDTHLDRFVAIKVLPAEKVADPERKRRFVQEAKAASALNHPNIVHVYDITADSGVDFIAMEFVAGKTLDQLISRKGMRLNDALKIAVQIADALARAHAAGIVHRDLKPSNIMLDEHGLVKVLDFGLAKLTETALGEDEATRTAKPRTEEGTIVGTAAYMSPEQAEGKPVDARSDIFSFGAVLYEMVTGQRAFRGSSRISTLSAVLHQDPAPFPIEVPKELQRVAARCLKKDPERRFHHMIDVKVALSELREESESGQLETPPRQASRRRGVWVWIAAALLVLCLGGAGWYWFSAGKTPPAEAAYRAVPFTNDPGVETDSAFSPDGNQVAFSWDGEKQDNFDIYLRLVGAGMGRPLRITTDPAPDYSPAFSPDGRTIAFLRDVSANRAAVCLVSALGGTERRLVEIENLPALRALRIVGRYLTWTPDGKWLAVSYPVSPGVDQAFGLFLLSVDSGTTRPLTNPQADSHTDLDPAFSPDGKSLAFIRGSIDARDAYVLPLTGDYRPARDAKRITFDSRWVNGIAWTPDGKEIVYSSGWLVDQALWRVPAFGSGPPRRVNWVGERGYLPAISRRGGRLVYQSYNGNKDLWRLNLAAPGVAAGKPVKLIASTQFKEMPDYSPDGRRIAYSSVGSGSYEIWVADAGGGSPRAVTAFGRGSTVHPRWSPDGKRIAFMSSIEGQGEIFVVGAEGGAPLRLTTHPAADWYPSYSRDGRWIYFTSTRTGESQIWKTPSAGGEPVQVTRTGGAGALESADGKFLYYSRSRLPSHFTGIWRVAAGGGEPEEIVPETPGILHFRAVEEGIYLVSWLSMDRSIPLRFFRFADGKIRTVAELGRQSYPSFCVSPDGRNIVYTSSGATENDIVLVENFR